MTSDELRAQIRRWGENVRDFFQANQRASLISPLFNVQGRLVLGGYCYFEHLSWILREVTAAAEPEELARRMKAVAVRPNYCGLHALMLGYFNGREQMRLYRALAEDEILREERREDDELVLDFWQRIGRVYVEHESWLPLETGHRLPVLPEAEVRDLAAAARDPSANERAAIRRMTAVTELFTFILNGEARVGVFHHGPYPLPGGQQLLVKELVGLREESLPWELQELPPVDAVARVLVLRDVETMIDLYGSLVARPFEYEDRITAEVLLGRTDGTLRELTADDVAEIERIASDGQLAMYEQAASWSPEYQIAYGADLYGSLVLPFCRAVGLDLRERIKTAFHETAERVVPRLLSGAEPPLVLERLGSTEGDIYSTAIPEAA